MEKDYSKLEGKEVVYAKTDGTKEVLIVAGCDPDVGLTLHAKLNKTDNRICLTGPLSPVSPAHKLWGNEKKGLAVYKAMFENIVDGIESGVINAQDALRVKMEAGNAEGSFSTQSDMECAFSQ